MRARRLGDGPIIAPDPAMGIGPNVQGPSLIEMPPWATRRLGRFHLYFADHEGDRIRLAYSDEIGGPYMRAFALRDHTHALTMPGHFSRSIDGLRYFESGPTLFEKNMRHSAVLPDGEILNVFWTRVGDTPERILRSTIGVSAD